MHTPSPRYVSLREFCRVNKIGMGTVRHYVATGVIVPKKKTVPVYDLGDMRKVLELRKKKAKQ
jgi:hypothetical protein